MAQLVITAVGPDRPGLVGQFTGHLHAAGANLADSRMINLRGQFAMIVMVEGSDAVLGELRKTLPGAGAQIGLAVTITPRAAASAPPIAGLPYRLKVYSMDQPGIVHRVSDLLRQHQVNIEELQTRLESAAFAGTPLFTMTARLTVPPAVPVRTLREAMGTLCEALNCDVDLEPA
jgi:glycine cleavage system transcriptional repressor